MAASMISAKPLMARQNRVAYKSVVSQPRRAMTVLVHSAPEKAQVEEAIKEAQDACTGGDAGECAAAWDTVEELSAAVSHAKAAKAADPTSNDPLEKYCADNPDADECRVYED